jgi:hypothetical protein
MAWLETRVAAMAPMDSGRKRPSEVFSACSGGHWKSAAAAGLKTVMRCSPSTQRMASSEELIMAASRFSDRRSS